MSPSKYATGGGLHAVGGSGGDGGDVANSGAVYSKNTLLADNRAGTSAGDAASDCAGNSLTSQGYNLFSAGECSDAATPSDLVGVAAQVAPLGNYGGSTWTCALLKVSPAIDAGSCTDSALNPVGEDQRGIARPQIDNCDIGAYEATVADPVRYAFLPVCRR